MKKKKEATSKYVAYFLTIQGIANIMSKLYFSNGKEMTYSTEWPTHPE